MFCRSLKDNEELRHMLNIDLKHTGRYTGYLGELCTCPKKGKGRTLHEGGKGPGDWKCQQVRVREVQAAHKRAKEGTGRAAKRHKGALGGWLERGPF